MLREKSSLIRTGSAIKVSTRRVENQNLLCIFRLPPIRPRSATSTPASLSQQGNRPLLSIRELAAHRIWDPITTVYGILTSGPLRVYCHESHRRYLQRTKNEPAIMSRSSHPSTLDIGHAGATGNKFMSAACTYIQRYFYKDDCLASSTYTTSESPRNQHKKIRCMTHAFTPL